MTVALRLWLSLGWFLLVLGVAAGVLAATLTADLPQARANSIAGATGTLAGISVVIGWSILWLPLAAAIGKRRREERERARKARQF